MMKRLEGIFPALVTPLDEKECVDEVAFRKLLRRVLEGGVHGVVVLGTAGEFAALADTEKCRAIEIAVSEVAGQVPVIVGTSEPGTRRALAMTKKAAELGADAALIAPPYYFPLNREATLRHYRLLAAESDLPIILYNIPSCTKVTLEPDLVRELAGEENIVGLKDSSGNFAYFQTLVRTVRSETFGVVTGSDHLLFPSLVVGGDGSIGPTANLVPDWFVELWKATREGQWDIAQEIHQRICSLITALYSRGGFPSSLKGALALLGICQPSVTAPNAAVPMETMEHLKGVLQQFALIREVA